MRISTTDPITLKDIQNPEGRPFVIEGEGPRAFKTYFENEETKKAYLGIDVEHPGKIF